jgi:hypothetical protein
VIGSRSIDSMAARYNVTRHIATIYIVVALYRIEGTYTSRYIACGGYGYPGSTRYSYNLSLWLLTLPLPVFNLIPPLLFNLIPPLLFNLIPDRYLIPVIPYMI